MKICFVSTGDINSLATLKRATGLSEPLIAKGYDVGIIALNCANNIARFAMECPNARLLLYQPSNAVQEIKQKHKLLKQFAPDIVYVLNPGIRNFITNITYRKAPVLVEHSELTSAIQNTRNKFIYSCIEASCKYLYDGEIMASRYLALTDEEIACIRWHMGAYEKDTKMWEYYGRAVEIYPNVLYTHTADMVASRIRGI